MNHFLLPFLLLFVMSCSNQPVDEITQEQNQPVLTTSDLEGQWKFVNVEKVKDTPFLKNYPNPNTAQEALIEVPYVGPDLIFEDDTMFEVYYPTHLGVVVHYSVEEGYLRYHSPWKMDSYPVQKVGDTLFIYRPYDGSYFKEGYLQTHHDDSVVTILKKYGVNYPELAGTWYLVRASSGNDGSEYVLKFPYEIPDSLVITREDLITSLANDYLFEISTDSKNRNYTLYYEREFLHFTPGPWYNGEFPWIHYSSTPTE